MSEHDEKTEHEWKFDPRETFIAHPETRFDFDPEFGRGEPIEGLSEQYLIQIVDDVVVSVIRGWYTYGGRQGLYEAAVVQHGEVLEPAGYLTEEAVREFIQAARIIYENLN